MKINQVGSSWETNPAAGGFSQGGKAALLSGRCQQDRVTLSKDALALAQSLSRIQEIRRAKEDAENTPEATMLESMKETMEILQTCRTIAARVQAGDKVPLKDLRYLMKHDIRGYQLAMSMRRQKENPKEWKSAIPEEREKTEAAGKSDSKTTQTTQTAQTAPSGGEAASSGGDYGGEGAQ